MPLHVLGSTKGALVADGYTGYDKVKQAAMRPTLWHMPGEMTMRALLQLCKRAREGG